MVQAIFNGIVGHIALLLHTKFAFGIFPLCVTLTLGIDGHAALPLARYMRTIEITSLQRN